MYMSIRDDLQFTFEEGKNLGKNLTLYALSTCGFCKAALRFLRKHDIAFKYVYVDNLPSRQKERLKTELKETYKERVMYPFLVIGGDDYIIGFDEDEWYERLDVGKSIEEGEGAVSGKDREGAKDAEKFVKMVAEKQGWRLHREGEFLDNLIKGLHTNKERYGYYLCPCRLGEGVKEKDKDIICPCEYSRPDIEEYGHCYCSLYQSPEFYFSGKEPKSIPERRPE
jgi:ferredoxin-thioredoxin reductase catalytic subunit/glutaredoxin